MSDTIVVEQNEFLIREGEESNTMYYLSSGTMAVFKIKGGTEQQIGTIYSGELVGEMSFLDDQPRSASVKAMSECELSVIPRTKLDAYFKGQPKWFQALVTTLLERLRKANSRIRI